ncbi:MAG: hypothetical protein JSU97_07750 [Dehalococcoidia bacterium]|nr:MAG: hypothetical protein JSU97_07750 [Dehalococcoidia bacterium]
MHDRRTRFALFLLGCALVLGMAALAWALGSGVSEADVDAMGNCPQLAKWSIAVWGGPDDTETGQALATCGTAPVDAAYHLDPQTQGWSRWFVGRPEITTLTTLDNMQGIIVLGAAAAPAPPPTLTPTPVATPTPSPTPVATPTTVPSPTWTGVWDTNWGNMELTQSDGMVTDTYAHDEGNIQGTVQGNKLIGTWSEYPSYGPPDDAGEFEFILSPDGNSFLGRWRYDSVGDWSEWTATRIS